MVISTILKFSHYSPTCPWRWNSVPKRRHTEFRRRRITQKKTYYRTRQKFEIKIFRFLSPVKTNRTGGTVVFLSLFSCIPVGVDGIFTSYITNTNGKVHSSGVSNFLMRFMRISTSLRPIIADTNQFLRFLRLIHLALNEIKSSNSECTEWVSIPRPTRLRYADRGHIFQPHVYYKNCTVTQQVTDTRGQQLSPQRPLWPLKEKKKVGHPFYRSTNVFITAYADIEKMDRPTPKASGTCNYVISSLCTWSDKFQLTPVLA
jgi:hypothetical protein